MNSIEKVGKELQEMCLEILEATLEAVNSDPRRQKIDLFKVAKRSNQNLKAKGFRCFEVVVSKNNRLEIDVIEEEEEVNGYEIAECNNNGNGSPQRTEA